MANKLLKSITFPDLTDKYIVGDTTLSVAGAGADAKATGDALATKANIDGSYEDLTAGNAEQLISNIRANDKTPYIFRTSGGSVDIGDREYVNGIVGGTVAWNQILSQRNGANVTAKFATMLPNVTLDVVANHKYLISFVQPAGCGIYRQNYQKFNGYGYLEYSAPSANTARAWIAVGTESGSSLLTGMASKLEATDTAYQLTDCMVIDLTQMFGTTIADYIYSLETANAGAGVAWFKKLFNKPYYAYNAGELKSVSGLVSHDMTGFNQASSDYSPTSASAFSNALLCKGQLLPNTTYCISFIGANGHKIYTDENLFTASVHKVCDGTRQYIVATTANVVSEDNASQYNSTYGWRIFKNDADNAVVPAFTDVCINISWDGSRDGEFEPYELHSYPLDSDLTLRGVPKLDANNNLYYDGDVYEADGTVNRKYGVVDLGTLTWYTNNSSTFWARIESAKTTNGYSNAVCDKYATSDNPMSSLADKQVSTNIYGLSALAHVIIKDTSYTDATAFKTAMSGVYLVYELATPTTETADAYQTPQIVDDFGTEEFVRSDNTFAVPVGHDTDYPVNLVAKLEMAPNSPEGNGDYIVRQTNGTNEYVPLVIEDALPTIPSEAGVYSLTVTVTEGADPVLEWTTQA